jgi:outer membrane lipoprotein SlyB
MTGDHYSASEARSVAEVSFGKIVHLREVTLDGSNSGTGSNGLSLMGSIAGSANGFGLKSYATSAGGGLLGSIVGTGVEERVTRKHGLEFVIQLDGGRTIAVVQQRDNTVYQVGQRVRVMVLNTSTRVVPDEDTLSNGNADAPYNSTSSTTNITPSNTANDNTGTAVYTNTDGSAYGSR